DYVKPPLDVNLWNIDDEELRFLTSETGIHDADELKKHIIGIQTKAYELYAYYCIRSFSFARMNISRMSAYPRAISLGRERPDAIMLDLGCCFGTDIRKVALDGFPVHNLIASDLRPEFWKLGHALFRSTPETFPVFFLPGDIFDRNLLVPAAPLLTSTSTAPSPNLSTVTSLTALNSHISIIHTSCFFHLFDEQKQTELAHLVAGLLSPLPGSMIFGAHVAKKVKGSRLGLYLCSDGHPQMFCHSPESWTQLWENVFPKGSIRVESTLKTRGKSKVSVGSDGDEEGLMEWSCIRV
ncbi:hypothetical protein C8R44DRAFT_923786, partial [Mycena epipterygia]